jgi:WD40 repeat protein
MAAIWLARVRIAFCLFSLICEADYCFTGEDKLINLWDIGSGKLIKSMSGHTSSIHSLSFSAESSILVSGSADCTVRIWDVDGSKRGDGAGGTQDKSVTRTIGLAESLSGAGALRRSSGIGLPDGLAMLEGAKASGGSGANGTAGRTSFGTQDSRQQRLVVVEKLNISGD